MSVLCLSNFASHGDYTPNARKDLHSLGDLFQAKKELSGSICPSWTGLDLGPQQDYRTYIATAERCPFLLRWTSIVTFFYCTLFVWSPRWPLTELIAVVLQTSQWKPLKFLTHSSIYENDNLVSKWQQLQLDNVTYMFMVILCPIMDNCGDRMSTCKSGEVYGKPIPIMGKG